MKRATIKSQTGSNEFVGPPSGLSSPQAERSSPSQELPPSESPKRRASNSGQDRRQAEAQKKGLLLLVDILKHKRKRRRLALSTVARRAGVPVGTVERLEAYDLGSVGLPQLLSIATVLGSELRVQIGPIRPSLPKSNRHILTEFDRLRKGRNCNYFIREQPDKEHPDLFWDIVGDKKTNWLFVVVSHRKRRSVRFGKVTDQPGGWSIAGQVWGIDAETESIARELSVSLFAEHRSALLGQPEPTSIKGGQIQK